MVDLKGKQWLITLIAGIIALLLAFFPVLININPDYSLLDYYWLFGAYIRTENGAITDSGFYPDIEYIFIGTLFFIIILIIGIFLILSAILTMKGKNIPQKRLILIIIGLFLFLLPTLYHLSFHILDAIKEMMYMNLFDTEFNSLMLFPPIAGALSILSGLQEGVK